MDILIAFDTLWTAHTLTVSVNAQTAEKRVRVAVRGAEFVSVINEAAVFPLTAESGGTDPRDKSLVLNAHPIFLRDLNVPALTVNP